MIIFLYGSDTYRRGRKLNEIVTQARAKYAHISVMSFDCEAGEGEEFGALREFVAQYGMFSSKKVAITYGLLGHSSKKEVVAFLQAVISLNDCMLIVCEDAALRKTSPFSFLLKPPVTAQEFGALTASQMAMFARQEGEAVGAKLSPDAYTFLLDYFKGDTWGLVTELRALGLTSRSLDCAGLHAVRLYEHAPDFFSSLMGLERGASAARLKVLETLVLAGEEPAKLFNMLASRAKSFEALQRFADYDIAVKSGALEYEEVLLDFVMSA